MTTDHRCFMGYRPPEKNGDRRPRRCDASVGAEPRSEDEEKGIRRALSKTPPRNPLSVAGGGLGGGVFDRANWKCSRCSDHHDLCLLNPSSRRGLGAVEENWITGRCSQECHSLLHCIIRRNRAKGARRGKESPHGMRMMPSTGRSRQE